MELDKRIENERLIYTPFATTKPKLHEKGYFTDNIHSFNNLKNCRYGELINHDDNQYSYCCEFNGGDTIAWFAFYIPESSLKQKEKQYRPYTLNEFLDKYTVCANIRIRQRDRTYQYFGKLIGYGFPTDPNTGKQNGDNDAIVCIGGYSFKLTELFTDYEQYDNMKDIWVPFGVEVEE